ncbi:MAG: DUF1844 domain-containing protein [Bdellovibrionota bacterium]|nr:MAG: DUF1844 domain-containing protein [Bdellovibrionota bacterium]
MSDDEVKKSTFRVVDRRRFDNEGNEKGAAASAEAAAPSKTATSDGVREKGQQGDFIVKDAPSPSIDFSSFVVSLATQALMQLGEVAPPPGVDIPTDAEAAMHTIEILSMLAEKTRGNLDAAESQLMEEVLHSLRLAFVKHKK